MKKIIFLFTAAIIIIACKSKSPVSTKLDNKSEVAIKGNWTISEVTYPGSDYIKVSSFDIADSKCFVGSTWKFISNNNKGNMALTKTDCPAFASNITWYNNKEGQFVMKMIDAGVKRKRVTQGVILSVANQTESSFQLIDRIDVGGKPIAVVYQFQRAN
ncbi:MAG: lipocalin family protein [Flavobacterium sp.]|nr:lipocalin family protein [Flavobacterium sp.]